MNIDKALDTWDTLGGYVVFRLEEGSTREMTSSFHDTCSEVEEVINRALTPMEKAVGVVYA